MRGSIPWCGAMFGSSLVLWSSLATAQSNEPIPSDEPNRPERPATVWSPGAVEATETTPDPPPDRVAFLAGLSSSGGFTGLGLAATRVVGLAGLEARISDRWWWLGRVSLAAGQTEQVVDGSLFGPVSTSTLTEFGLATGVRWVANPGDRVEVSPRVLLAGGYGTFGGSSTDSSAWQVSALAGAVMDVALVPRFGLRLGADVLRGTYGAYELGSGEAALRARTWSAGLTLQPSLEARVAF